MQQHKHSSTTFLHTKIALCLVFQAITAQMTSVHVEQSIASNKESQMEKLFLLHVCTQYEVRSDFKTTFDADHCIILTRYPFQLMCITFYVVTRGLDKIQV